MTISAKDRRYVLINTVLELDIMFTALGGLCSIDDDKVQFLGEIEAALKKCLRSLDGIEPIKNQIGVLSLSTTVLS